MNWFSILMVAAILFTVMISVSYIRRMKQNASIYYTEEIVAMWVAAGSFLCFVYAAGSVYRPVFIMLGLVNIVEFALLFLHRIMPKKIFYFGAKVLLIASLLEVTLFNLPSYHLWLGDYEQQTLDLSTAYISDGDFVYDEERNALLVEGDEEVLIRFDNLNSMVGTVSVDIFFGGDTSRTKLVIDMSDETSRNYRYDIAKQDIVRFNKQTQIVPCHFSGEVSDIRLKFTGYSNKASVMISAIRINEPIPFSVSYLRILLIVGLALAVYAICICETAKKPVYQVKKLYETCSVILTAGFLAIAVLLIAAKIPKDVAFKEVFMEQSGDQMTQELVEAFEHGQVSLLIEPDEELVAMENPYDRGMRNEKNVSAKWDHVYYEGKYYSYYGIAPVILVFLPFHLLTGQYMTANIAVLLFSIIGILFLTLLYQVFLKRWFPSTPFGAAVAGQIILFASCGIWFCLGRPKFYEIAIAAGFMFLTMGVYYLFSSNIIGEEKIRPVRLALSSLFLALSVLSRPTLALYCICACIFYLYGVCRKTERQRGEVYTVSKKRRTLYIVCAFLPMMLLGMAQMWYNYARFGSPLEFGIQYSLTINDFTHTQYHTSFALISIFNYLCSVPGFSFGYPFISTPFTRLDVNGYFFKDTGNTSGVLFLALPVFAYFLSRKALEKLPDKSARLKSLLLIGLPCVIMPIAIMAAAWESGYSVRYLTDFSWQMVLGAYAVLFFLYTKCKNETKKDFVRKGMAFAVVWSVLVCFVQVYNFTFSQSSYPYLASLIEGTFAFWK